MSETFNFNLLTDPWIPLLRDGEFASVSLRSLLTDPDSDAVEMGHPREDFGFLARVLASAIVQALWPVEDRDALDDRLAGPMNTAEYDAVADRFRESFFLLGDRGFMQAEPQTSEGQNHTDRLLLDVSGSSRPKLLRHERAYDGLCPACMVLGVFGAQLLAAQGGRGYAAALRGPSSLLTLVWAPSVRKTVWLNTLIGRHGPITATPWRGSARSDFGPKGSIRRDTLSLSARGVFWQPRSFRCQSVVDGRCAACGSDGARVGAFDFGAGRGAELSEGFYQDPWLPIRRWKQGPRPQQTPTGKPVWTGLADMLTSAAGSGEVSAEKEPPEAAPVVLAALTRTSGSVQILVFGQFTDSASLTARFSETLTVTMRPGNEEVLLDALRGRVQQAEACLALLKKQLRLAWSANPKSKVAYWPHDAAAAFWRETEAEFFVEKKRLESDAPAAITSHWAERLHAISLGVFDRLTEDAAVDPVRAERVSHARRGLIKHLNALCDTRKTTAEATS